MSSSLAYFSGRNVLLALLLVLVPYILFIICFPPDRSGEETLAGRLDVLRSGLQHLDMRYRSQEEELSRTYSELARRASFENLSLSVEAELLLSSWSKDTPSIRPPSTFSFLPHLLLEPNSLTPAFFLSKGRSAVSVVMGVLTVRHQMQTCLLDTLESLLDGMSFEERNDTIIVVFIADAVEDNYVAQVASEIKERFEEDIESGLIEVISPPVSYYPSLDKLKASFGDTPECVRLWTKQNLDFIFLAMYAQPKGMFYLQLEDDIVAKPQYLSTIKSVALDRNASCKTWFIHDFCKLGFNGKLFRCEELPWLVQFFLMFYSDHPVDRLLERFLAMRAVGSCPDIRKELWVHHKPLFQHIGAYSCPSGKSESVCGKYQELKHKQFGEVSLFVPHSNPAAYIVTNIEPFKQYTLERAYTGETFFWGIFVQPGDFLLFTFIKPINLKRFLFRSGNVEHPLEHFYNTTVEVLPCEPPSKSYDKINYTADEHVILGRADKEGLIEGKGDSRLGPIEELRVTLHSVGENGIILSELMIEADEMG